MDLDPASVIAGLLVGSVGFALFVFGKKQQRVPQLAAGGLLMVLPMIVTAPWAMLGVAAAMVVGLWLCVRAGC